MATIAFSLSSNNIISPLSTQYKHPLNSLTSLKFLKTPLNFNKFSAKICCSSETTIPTFTTTTTSSSQSDTEEELEQEHQIEERESNPFPSTTSSSNGGLPPPVLKKRKRYRKEYPGESKGITEEMRFVAMKLRNDKGSSKNDVSDNGDESDGTWEPSIEGFLKYLVDSKLVFETIERVVEDSNDVSYAYFRRTGLERSEGLAQDLEWFSQQGMAIPEPSNPGISYASYLKELAETSAPLFLSHFYNVYFSHIAAGQVIAKQVADKLLKERQLEFFNWDGDEQVFLQGIRETLNRLAEHWSRDDKNKCLKETTKSFRYLGQILRLIIIL
ncbi:probable inactive heme oxygenase 2, chloroplastic [Chenopodium quinoa]|uniref:probable inactive heme oxygenase 2, chloroplastic n=1 Tax=Chenopodium quinoa TaxID=63459 RepID=UPI000B776701|nr:probable inactive heme oxygenase 2, chloroplastic [Chenopodium quinoa]XP_021729612.1 probable inactive heme oxygenase 2, chloroplastic [Chenopodium quinoa]